MPKSENVVGLILGAGEGRRFGAIKQLARFRGRPLIEWPLAAIGAAEGIDRLIVVLGFEAERIEAEAELGGAEVVVCEDWHRGQAASLRRGLEAATAGPRGAAAVVVALADQPLISTDAVDRLLAARGGRAAALRAGYGGRAGHPVLLERSAIEAAAGLEGDRGAGAMLHRMGTMVVPCDGLGSDADADTPARLRELEGWGERESARPEDRPSD